MENSGTKVVSYGKCSVMKIKQIIKLNTENNVKVFNIARKSHCFVPF